jgi:uncharacterized integral membrane protein
VTDTQPTPAPDSKPKPQAKTAGRGAGSNAKLILVGVVAVFVVLFIAMNTHDTKVDFVFGSTKISVIWVILLSVAPGFALGASLPQLRRRRRGKKS